MYAEVVAHCPLTLQGQCNGHPVMILIDSRATHDFVAQKFVSRLVPTQVMSCISHTIKWADGRACTSDQRLEALVKIGAYQEQRPLLVCTIEGYDVILGKPWLTDHNPLIDWRCHTVHLSAPTPKVEVEGPPLSILLKGKVFSLSAQQPFSEVRGLPAVKGETTAWSRREPPRKKSNALVESLLVRGSDDLGKQSQSSEGKGSSLLPAVEKNTDLVSPSLVLD